MEVFKDYAFYYDTIYRDKDYEKEAKDIDSIITRNKEDIYGTDGTGKGALLNIGCGTGRHDYELCQLGYVVDGIDMSEEMIKIARKNHEKDIKMGKVNYRVGDFVDFRPIRKYDVVTALFHVISYQNRNLDLINCFRTANFALKMGGLFLFDVWYGPGVMNELPENRIKRVEDSCNQIFRFAEPVLHFNRDMVEVKYDVLIVNKETAKTNRIKETHQMRYFFYPELDYMLENTGFHLLECIDCSSLSEADEKSWTVYLIAKKIKENVEE